MEEAETNGARSLWAQTDGDAHADGPHYTRSAPRRLARPTPSSPSVDYAHEAVRRQRAAPIVATETTPDLEPWRRIPIGQAPAAVVRFAMLAEQLGHQVAARATGDVVQLGVNTASYGLVRATWKAARFVNATGDNRRMTLTEAKALLLR